MRTDTVGAVWVAAVLVSSGCASAPPGGECGGAICVGGTLCIDDIWRKLCNSDGPQANIDYLWIEIYTTTSTYDCDDSDPTVWLGLTGFADGDGDLYASGPATPSCGTGTLPPGYSPTNPGADSDDQNANAHPNQTGYFSTARSDGSYDYNCDGSDDPAVINTFITCACGATCTGTIQQIVAAPCGGSNNINTCTGTCLAGCNSTASTPSTACRQGRGTPPWASSV